MKKLRKRLLLLVLVLLTPVCVFVIYYFFYIPQYEFSQVRLDCSFSHTGGETKSFIELNNDGSMLIVSTDKCQSGTRILTQEEFDELNKMIKDVYKLNRAFMPGNVSLIFRITLTIDGKKYHYNSFDLEAPWYVKNGKVSRLANKLIEYSPIEMKTWNSIHEGHKEIAENEKLYGD